MTANQAQEIEKFNNSEKFCEQMIDNPNSEDLKSNFSAILEDKNSFIKENIMMKLSRNQYYNATKPSDTTPIKTLGDYNGYIHTNKADTVGLTDKSELYSEITKRIKNQSVDYKIRKYNPLIKKESPRAEKISSSVEKANLLYGKYKEKQAKTKFRCEQAKLEREMKEVEGCTFTPDIKEIKSERKEFGEVYERNKNWINKKQAWIDKEKSTLIQKNSNNYTFKPAINKNKVYYPEVDEKQQANTMRYKERMIEVEKLKQLTNSKLMPDYSKAYDQNHQYQKNLDQYLDKIGSSTSKNQSGGQSTTNSQYVFGAIELDKVMLILSAELKNADINVAL